MDLKYKIKKVIRIITPSVLINKYRAWTFDESQIIYKDKSYQDFLEESLVVSRPGLSEKERKLLLADIKEAYLTEGIRPDEYLLYGYDGKNRVERSAYLSQHLKDTLLLEYYKPIGMSLIGQLRDKYQFYLLAKRFFKRDVITISENKDWDTFSSFCKAHPRFICKVINQGCGVGVKIEEVRSDNSAESIFKKLLDGGSAWVIEELINQNVFLADYNTSSVNTVRFPSFRHGDVIVQKYPCIRFGRYGCCVDNAGQGGVFASIDIDTGEIITNGFDELGNEYETHPDSKTRFKGAILPQWSELREEARQVHLSLPREHTYIAFDFALSDRGWMLVEGNWGDWILQQTSFKRGMKSDFLSLLYGE